MVIKGCKFTGFIGLYYKFNDTYLFIDYAGTFFGVINDFTVEKFFFDNFKGKNFITLRGITLQMPKSEKK